ncbi:MAG: hypothetical protein NVSMB6_14550 [Burkholderiaceae bacterium]
MAACLVAAGPDTCKGGSPVAGIEQVFQLPAVLHRDPADRLDGVTVRRRSMQTVGVNGFLTGQP